MRPWIALVIVPAAALLAAAPPARAARPRIERVAARAQLFKGDFGQALVWGKDVEAMGFSADAEFQNKALAFVGFGIQVPGGYDDFAGIELKDRVAVIARSVPDLPAFAHLPMAERSLLARLRKLEHAQVAAVIVLADGPLHPPQREEGPAKLDLPVLVMPPATLAADCGDLAARLQKIRETGQPQSQDFIYAPWTTLSLGLKRKRTVAAPRARD
jgi:hypothetical protein